MKKYMSKIYWGSTGLFSLLILMGVGQYFLNTAEASKIFESLGYPGYLVIPLGIAKLAGIIAIISDKNKMLKEWAYAGFFFVLVLGVIAHIQSGVPSPIAAFSVLVLLIISYESGLKRDRASTPPQQSS